MSQVYLQEKDRPQPIPLSEFEVRGCARRARRRGAVGGLCLVYRPFTPKDTRGGAHLTTGSQSPQAPCQTCWCHTGTAAEEAAARGGRGEGDKCQGCIVPQCSLALWMVGEGRGGPVAAMACHWIALVAC